MPLNNPAPQFGLLTEYDMRAYSGVEVFDRSGGSAVSLEAYNSAGVGHGIFEDLIFFLIVEPHRLIRCGRDKPI